MSVPGQSPPTHTLYHFYFSICSLYARYAYALRGPVKNGATEVRIEEKHIDLRAPQFEQLQDWYLCDVNGKGEVPVLVTRHDNTILPDSRAIIYKLAESYPRLLPPQHEREIKRLSDELHKVEYYALTFTNKFTYPGLTIALLLERMSKEDIDGRYYKAMDHKISCITQREIPGLTKKSFIGAIAQTKIVFEEVKKLLKTTQTDWILGTAHPTALDAQVIVFVSRLQDCARDELIPKPVRDYAAKAFQMPEWKDIMQDRQTIPPEGF